ncbi:MAG: pirin family protein [Rhodocyclaceae bacterium]|nr:pirin family protein [Rhodocyclaceae bacterium]
MIQVRKSSERGHANHGWLDTYHTFSFADYYDPAQMGWGALRVINDDRVAPGMGFGMHGHRDMEIITYVLDGSLQHRDSMGNGTIIETGDVQRMSAGKGVMHSEFNPSNDKPVHLLQIWIVPNVIGIRPSYEQTRFADADKRGRLRLIASNDGRDGSVTIHQDATVHAALLGVGEKVACEIAPSRVGYLHVARGRVSLDGLSLEAGDGARIGAQAIRLEGIGGDGEVLLFDLPA